METPLIIVLEGRSKKIANGKGDLYGAKEEAAEAQMSDKEKLAEAAEEEKEGVRPEDLKESADLEDMSPLTDHLSDAEKERMLQEKPKSLASYAMRDALMKAKEKKKV